MKDIKELIELKWEEILSLLESEYDISNVMIDTWIRSLKIYEVKDSTLYFYVDEKLGVNALKFIKRREYDVFLLSSIRETLNDSMIDIVIDEKKNLIDNKENENDTIQESDSYQEAVSRSNRVQNILLILSLFVMETDMHMQPVLPLRTAQEKMITIHCSYMEIPDSEKRI